jgi:hypothetical protein
MACIARVLATTTMLVVAGCASAPVSKPPPVFHVVVTHTPAAAIAAPTRGAIAIGSVDDARSVQDRTRIGEVHAPMGPVPVVGGPQSAGAIIALQLLMLANTQPTGWYVYAKGTEGLAPPIERALGDALASAGYGTTEPAALRLDGTIRSFWLTPSWSTRCDAEVELRLSDDSGALLWLLTIVVHVDQFVGWFTNDAFEAVVRLAMDQLVQQAAMEFTEPEFLAAVSGR